MKGIIFNLLEAFIVENLGEDKYDEIEDKCELQTTEPFVGPGSYPDEDILAIVISASDEFNISVDDFFRRWGRFCVPILAEKFPGFFEKSKTAKEFLSQVDNMHYTEVVKLYKDAVPPKFIYEDPGADKLIMHYTSERKLCHLMLGLIEGVGDQYETTIEIIQTKCLLEGDESCDIELTFK